MKRFEQWKTRAVWLVASLIMILTLAGSALVPAVVSADSTPSCSWTGAGSDDLWSDASNWSCTSGTIPANGYDLTFDTSKAQLTNDNDITGLKLHQLSFTGGPLGNYHIQGKAFSLSSGIISNTTTSPYFENGGITATGNLTFDNSGGAVTLTGAANLNLGKFNLITTGTYEPAIHSEIIGSGTVTVDANSLLEIAKASPDFSGSFIVGANGILQDETSGSALGTASVDVSSGGMLAFYTSDSLAKTYTVANDLILNGTGAVSFSNTNMGVPVTDTINLSGTINLVADATVYLDNYNLNLTGRLDTNGYTISGAGGTLTNNAQGYDDDLTSAPTNQPLTVLTPAGTLISSDSAETAPSDSAGYNYPLGLVNYSFTNANTSNQVSLTFVTDLKPSDVVARKYNATTKTYTDIPDATITETTYNGQPALRLTYAITDNGPLDTNSAAGTITDPVGLAIRSDSSSSSNDGNPKTPNTGYGVARHNLGLTIAEYGLGAVLLLGLAFVARRFAKRYN